jgi:hypothetical protein
MDDTSRPNPQRSPGVAEAIFRALDRLREDFERLNADTMEINKRIANLEQMIAAQGLKRPPIASDSGTSRRERRDR